MKIFQHIPGFVTGIEAIEAEVNSTDELLALPWIRRWTTLYDKDLALSPAKKFKQFSTSFAAHRNVFPYYLSAEYEDGSHYVIGFTDERPQLPESSF